jgi:hypothetical protein
LGLLASIIGAVLVFVSSFLTWASVNAKSSVAGKVSGASVDYLGVSSHRLGFATLVLSIAALALCAVMLLPATKPWAWKVLIGTGALVALLAIIELIQIPQTLHANTSTCTAQGVTCTLHRSIGPGVWFTLIAGILVAAGAYVHHIRPVQFRSQLAGRATPAAPAAQAPEAHADASEPAQVPLAKTAPSPGPAAAVRPSESETVEERAIEA